MSRSTFSVMTFERCAEKNREQHVLESLRQICNLLFRLSKASTNSDYTRIHYRFISLPLLKTFNFHPTNELVISAQIQLYYKSKTLKQKYRCLLRTKSYKTF